MITDTSKIANYEIFQHLPGEKIIASFTNKDDKVMIFEFGFGFWFNDTTGSYGLLSVLEASNLLERQEAKLDCLTKELGRTSVRVSQES